LTSILPSVTVTSQVTSYPPSSVVTVIIASPALIALTFPFSSTVTTDSSLELQVTFLLVASSGKIVAVSCVTLPTIKSNELSSNEMPVTGTTFSLTVTSQVSVYSPSSVIT